jgi:translation initiation factor 5A
MPEIQVRKVIDLKKGSYIWYNNEVWEVLEIETVKTGKHGSAKAKILIKSVVSGRTTELVKPTQDLIEVPVINKIKGQVIAKISDDKYTVMDLDTYETFDARVLDENLKGKIQEGQKVLVWDVGEKIIVQAFRE